MPIENSSSSTTEPLVSWSIPKTTPGEPVLIAANSGQITCVVGANGAGKSALGLWLQRTSAGATVVRLSAHRRLWFEAAGPDISPAQRESAQSQGVFFSSQPDARYVDRQDSQRASIVLFDMLALLNSQNGKIAELALANASQAEIERTVGMRILDRLNRILDDSGLPIQIRLTERQTFNAFNAARGAEYPIFKMSDGEKSAVLLACQVLTAPESCVQILDEPERHLHRSISAGLVEAISEARPDCHFVVLTHDLELASSLETKPGQTFVLTDCVWSGDEVTTWELFPVGNPSEIPENARQAILGGRQRILFLEGQSASLDSKLYRLLFPKWGLSPAGGADQVVRAVTGLRSSQSHHWIKAQGVVDGDGRSAPERESLLTRGVLPLPVSEVESLYYLDPIVEAVATSQAAALGRQSKDLANEARTMAFKALRHTGTFERLASKLALAETRRRIVDELPTSLGAEAAQIEISFPSPYAEVLKSIQALSANDDLDGLIRLLPIRDTPLRSNVATALGFRNADDYESAVRVRVKEDSNLAAKMSEIVGPLPTDT